MPSPKSVKQPSKAALAMASSPGSKSKTKPKKAGGLKKTKPKKQNKTALKAKAGTSPPSSPEQRRHYASASRGEPAGDVERSQSFVFHNDYTSNSEREADRDDDDDTGVDDSDVDHPNVSGTRSPTRCGDEDIAAKRGNRPVPQRTWSVGAFSAANSVGADTIGTNLYLEDASSYSEYDDSEEDSDFEDYRGDSLLSPKKKTKRKKLTAAEKPVRRMTKKDRKKQRDAEQRAAAALRAMAVPEDNGNDGSVGSLPKTHVQGNVPSSRTAGNNNVVALMTPVSGTKKKGKKRAKAPKDRKNFPPLDEITLDSGEFDDTREGGYNSDGALSRKKALLRQKKAKKRNGKKNQKPNEVIIDFELEDIVDNSCGKEPKKKMGRRNSTGTLGSTVAESKKNKKLGKEDAIAALRAAAAAAEEEAAARAAAAESDDEYLMEEPATPKSMASLPLSSNEKLCNGITDDIKRGSKTAKDDTKKKLQELDDYFKAVDKSAPDLLQGDYGCNMSVMTGKTGMEALDNLLKKSKNNALQKEREAIAFERESLELQLSEELQKNEELTMQILELEQQLQSQQYSNANDIRGHQDWTKEREELKAQYEREKNDLVRRLGDKNREIQDLQRTVKDFEILREKSGYSPEDSEGKSKERLQGELLQTVAKLTEKEARLESQCKELEETKAELAELALGSGVDTLKDEISTLMAEKQEEESKRKAENVETAAKLKDKDETISYLMGELARLKQEQSQAGGSIGGILYPNQGIASSSQHSTQSSDMSLSRRGSSILNSLRFQA